MDGEGEIILEGIVKYGKMKKEGVVGVLEGEGLEGYWKFGGMGDG